MTNETLIYLLLSFIIGLKDLGVLVSFTKFSIKNRVVSLFDALHIGLVGEPKEEARDAAAHSFVSFLCFSIYDICIFEYYI